jgi:predicted kinase
VADSTALRREARRELLNLARRHKVPAVLIVFDVSEERAQTLNARRRGRRVGRPVIRDQWERLQEALRTAREEGFDQVYILGEDEVGTAQVRVAAARDKRAGSQS